MKKIIGFFIAVVLICTSCTTSYESELSDIKSAVEKLPDIESGIEKTKTVRIFRSKEDETNYNNYVAGKISQVELFKKYKIGKDIQKELSTKEWDKVLKGTEQMPGQVQQKVARLVLHKPDLKLSEITNQSKKIPSYTQTNEFGIIYQVNFKGNCWWWSDYTYVNFRNTLYSDSSDGSYLAGYFAPCYNNYIHKLEGARFARGLSIHYMDKGLAWKPKWKVADYIIPRPFWDGTYKNARIDYDYYAWFKFFWTEQYIIQRRTVNN